MQIKSISIFADIITLFNTFAHSYANERTFSQLNFDRLFQFDLVRGSN